MYRGVPPLGYLLAPPWSSINNLWWWLFLMWGFMVGGQPKLRVGGRHHARAADIARSCMCSSQFFSFFENFSKCFWLFKGEKTFFSKRSSKKGHMTPTFSGCLSHDSNSKHNKFNWFQNNISWSLMTPTHSAIYTLQLYIRLYLEYILIMVKFK